MSTYENGKRSATKNGKLIALAWSTTPVTFITHGTNGENGVISHVKQRHIISGKAPKGFAFFIFDLKVKLGQQPNGDIVFHVEHNIEIPGKNIEEAALSLPDVIEKTDREVRARVLGEMKKHQRKKDLWQPGMPLQ